MFDIQEKNINMYNEILSIRKNMYALIPVNIITYLNIFKITETYFTFHFWNPYNYFISLRINKITLKFNIFSL